VSNPAFRAVLWDFGGVLTQSPFEAFARFERERQIPEGFLRRVNATSPDSNAWARFERGDISAAEFDVAFERETKAAGYAVPGGEVVRLLYGEIRPTMVEALRRCKPHYITACLTNNVNTGTGHELPTSAERAEQVADVLALFDHVIESSKVGMRKPEARFYALALERIGVAAREAVFLDDLGVNLKPAKAMGMTTIKVETPAQAVRELENLLQLPLGDALRV
jgi:putative hydrolase of the HAD superfamily